MDATMQPAAGRSPDAPVASPGAPHDRETSNPAERLQRAQHALLSRRRLSIRLRLVASLLLCFCLCCAFAVAAKDILSRARGKFNLLQTIERLDDRILRVRAFEDEGILSGGDIDKVLEGTRDAEDLFHKEAPALQAADREVLPALLAHLGTCRRLLTAVTTQGRERGGFGVLTPTQAVELRHAETETNRLLEAMIRRERVSLSAIFRLAETGPLVLVGVLFVLFAVITYCFAQALVNPIRRFEGYTSRIAVGDFSLIGPARGYRDEFSDLAVAVNQMLAALQEQQNRLVKGARLAVVGTMTSGIAHELNNPLNNISITAETLMEESTTLTDEDRWRLLQDIYFETERASEIVKSLLDFTRQEKREMVPLELGEIILSTLRLSQNEMNINNVTVAYDVPPDLPRIQGAANQLRQVFLNLFLNAIQAMPSGGVLRVSAGVRDHGGVCVEVHDEGAGIPAEILPRIFDPFFTTKEPGKGTGLGLSVSSSIIKKLGGDIQVASELGKGTTVHVCLPRAEEQ
jgi:two-component system NtrC family sensor kinase